MIAAWMLYTVAVTFLLLAGATAADHVARAVRAPTALPDYLALSRIPGHLS